MNQQVNQTPSDQTPTPSFFETYRARRLFLPRDVVLLAVFVLLCVVAVVLLVTLPQAGAQATVYHNGEVVLKLNLKTDATLTLTHEGEPIEICVKDGSIAIAKSGCPSQICVHMGEISKSNQTIVCAPYKILISIQTKNSDDYEWVTGGGK